MRSFRTLSSARRASVISAAVVVVSIAGCGGGDDESARGTEQVAGSIAPVAEADPVSGEGNAARGQQLAQDSGCQSCHQAEDGLAPTWNGVYGMQVTLDDGTTVIADDAYLAQAIRDPGSQKLEGYAVAMPTYDDLTDQDVDDLVAYIRSLGE